MSRSEASYSLHSATVPSDGYASYSQQDGQQAAVTGEQQSYDDGYGDSREPYVNISLANPAQLRYGVSTVTSLVHAGRPARQCG